MLSCHYPNIVVWLFKKEIIEIEELMIRSKNFSNFFLQIATYEHYGMFSCVVLLEDNILYEDVLVRVYGKFCYHICMICILIECAILW